MSTEEYWEGRLFVYHATVTNGAGGDGDISFLTVPGQGNELEILYGHLHNGDTVGRTGTIDVETDTGGQLVARLMPSVAFAAAARRFFPSSELSGDNLAATAKRWIISGTQRMNATIAAVGASDDVTFAFAARLRGGMPTITEAGASTPTITINEERVY